MTRVQHFQGVPTRNSREECPLSDEASMVPARFASASATGIHRALFAPVTNMVVTTQPNHQKDEYPS